MQQANERATKVRPIARRPKRQLPFPLNLYQTAVGKKWVMALTGIALLGYVLAHMIGNLKLYFGPEDMNAYADWLRHLLYPALPEGWMLWIMRAGLLVAFVLHLHSAYSLTMMNRAARPVGYQGDRDYIAADFAGRTMRWSGIIVLLFIVWHLLDLTIGAEPVNGEFISHDPYNNVVASFERPLVAAFYVVANLALGLHIFHGAWSMFQSLGANNPKLNPIRRPFAVAFAAIVVVGNVSFPIAVQAGLVDQDNRTTPYADEVHEEALR
ncbi:succinate dehydrogenase cytochrome b subunit [Actinomarinicola tropica]|uniref:Succinate dehydrogenase n=1 Tax=Actinomarinicola tropica TaxID=2789776 RepID=A0A5Q2RAQ6_9ACTN|nr:succinate dehydrogenase cytochrome b subunit [Actinomarinicola tropica]QGG93949.1 succinate dehydrogenase [Actinomarinicola tropica]